MAGYVIHLAVGCEYYRRHEGEIKDKLAFLNGCIAPDLTEKENKSITHYGNGSCEPHLREFLKEREIESDYDKGYFLHLVTDYIFYNKLLDTFSKEIYNDYDILNEYLIQKYDVEIVDDAKDKISFAEGETKILSKEVAEKTIDICSEKSLSDIKNEILNTDYSKEWEEIRKLNRI